MSDGSSGSMPEQVPVREAHRFALRVFFFGGRAGLAAAGRAAGAPDRAGAPAAGRASRAGGLARQEHDLVRPVLLAHADLDGLVAGRGERAADVVGADRQLAVAAVDEHGQLDAGRPAEVDQLVERGAHRPAGEQYVVDEHDRAPVDREEDVGALRDRLRGEAREVVPVQRDVERADGGLGARRLRDRPREAPGERHAAGAHAHEGQLLHVGVALEDLVRDAGERAGHPARVHQGDAGQGGRMLTRRGRGRQGPPEGPPLRAAPREAAAGSRRGPPGRRGRRRRSRSSG